jgi:hypothetical protein
VRWLLQRKDGLGRADRLLLEFPGKNGFFAGFAGEHGTERSLRFVESVCDVHAGPVRLVIAPADVSGREGCFG